MSYALKFKKDGSWTAVKKPWIKHEDAWRDVHHVWIKHGGTWRKIHRTAISEYSVVNSTTIYATTSDQSGTYTVPAGVRYLRIHSKAQGGGGGAGAGTGGAGIWDGHYGCSGGSTNVGGGFHNHVAGGGTGGAGGMIDVKIEVAPGDTFSWEILQVQTSSVSSSRLELPANTAGGSIVGAGASATGATGVNGGGKITFSGVTTPGVYEHGAGATGSAIAYPGLGGTGGKVQVSSNCTSGSGSGEPWGYEVAETNGSNGNNGSADVGGQWIVISNSSGTGFSGRPGAPDSYPESNGSPPEYTANDGSTSPFLLIQEYS